MQNNNDQSAIVDEECTVLPLSQQSSTCSSSLAALLLTKGILHICDVPLSAAKRHFTELVGKQSKIHMDLSAEKFHFDKMDIGKLQDMMNIVKDYQQKLLKIRQKMHNIYQRTKLLKRRAENLKTPI